MILDILIILLMGIGALFMFLAGLGVVRFPDLYIRISATSKAATLGVAFILVAFAVYFSNDIGVITRAIATVAFLLLTAPIAAHMIGRAAYMSGEPLTRLTVTDEFREYCDYCRQPISASAENRSAKNRR